MKSIKVTFNYQDGYSANAINFTIEATVTPGIKSVRGEFDRFKEPDDNDTVEITGIIDDDGLEHPQSIFSFIEIAEINSLAIEAAAEEAEPEYED